MTVVLNSTLQVFLKTSINKYLYGSNIKHKSISVSFLSFTASTDSLWYVKNMYNIPHVTKQRRASR